MRWFKHVVNAHADIKLRRLIAEHDFRAYGLFFLILELIGGEGLNGRLGLAKVRPEDIAVIANIDPKYVSEVLNKSIAIGLFQMDGTALFCPRLINGYSDDWGSRKRRKAMLDIVEAKIMYGSKSTELRSATEIYASVYKDERSKHMKQIEQIISYLNSKSSKSYRIHSSDNQLLITARLKEGYSVEDMCKVVDNMCEKWLGDEKMEQYLRPATLFQRSKIEGYLNVDKGLSRRIKDIQKGAGV